MVDWSQHYCGHTLTAEEAVRVVQSGNLVVLGDGCGQPRLLLDALIQRAFELCNVRIFHILPMGEMTYLGKEYSASFRHVTTFAGQSTRKALAEGRADFIPCFFHELPHLLETHLRPDVTMVTVTPPDDEGYCSLGVSVDYTRKAVQVARTVIAEVNPSMPHTGGDARVHVSEFDWFVRSELPIYEQPAREVTDAERRVGRFVAELIEDGDCLQLGIGGIPDAVLANLTGSKDLGIHTELFSDGLPALVEQGVITGRRKTLYPERIVATLSLGSHALHDWLNDNPLLEMRTVDYVNNPYVIAQNQHMVAVNSALEVDLLGQVNAETLGSLQFSGVGGQIDFIRGACMSEGGRAIIALASTTKNGQVSRIVPTLSRGAAITTSRNDVDYVVTDNGIAALRGRSVRERMKALIGVAHPSFRADLERQASDVYGVHL